MLAGPPQLKTESYQMRRVLRAGDSMRLTCPVESPPPAPLIKWLKDGDAVHVGWDRYRTHGDALRVRDVDPSDSGVFICRATNGFGTVDVRFLVYGQSPINAIWPVCAAPPLLERETRSRQTSLKGILTASGA